MNNGNAVKQPEDIEDGYEQTAEEAEIERQQTVQLFGSGLQTKFDREVGLKEEIEQRWLDDLRHYNGRYDRDTESKMNTTGNAANTKAKSSKIFVNLTRAKTNIAESKWSDLVLPTDDRNWGLKPTPVPDLAKELENQEEIQLADGSTPIDPETEEAYTHADMADETMKQAVEAAKLMETEIDDQLVEARYNSKCREIIHDAVTLGIGIMKGPMVERKNKKQWKEGDNNQWQLGQTQGEYKPTAERVDPWNFFPDMTATCWDDCEFVFERHLMTRKQLRKLANQPGYMRDQLRNVLMQAPNGRVAKLNYLNELREINGITQIQNDNRYEVLEYHGPIDKDQLVACGCEGVDEQDPLEEFEGTVWLCMGTVIKVSLNHMDSEELPYNILNWEKDETSIFGFGVPYRMRGPQRVMNASWRMVLDNAGLSTGPQIIINKSLVQPQNGDWELTPRKIWWMTSKDPKMRADYAMQTFNIDSNQRDLVAIFEMAKQLGDEETSVPNMNMGATGPDQNQPAMMKTLGGTQLWMSANNIMMRRAVKNFDDDITVPFLGRFYDWNMQFNKKNEIKGDYTIDARGTSVLLVREMQARNIQEFINAAMSLPGGDKELKTRGVLKNMAKGMQVSVDDVMRSDEEFKTAEEEEKNNPPQDPEMLKLEAAKALKQMEIDAKREETQQEAQLKMATLEGERQIALINREVELTKISANNQTSMEKIRSDAGIEKYKTDWNIKAFYEEAAIKAAEGEQANFGLEATE